MPQDDVVALDLEVAEVLAVEDPALVGSRSPLIHRRKPVGALDLARLLEVVAIEALGPERLPDLPAERIVSLGERRQADLGHGIAAVARSLEQSAGEVCLVPAGHDDHNDGAGLEAGAGGRKPPLPLLVSN